MKRAILTIVLAAAVIFQANAQLLKIENIGENLPTGHMTRIIKTLTKEVEFYGPLGIPDTVSVKLRVFDDMDKANTYMRQYVPTAYGRFCSGMFLPMIETAVIASTENMDSAVKTMFHEISHFLFHKAMDKAPYQALKTVYSLDEGLASYFGFMRIKKDGSTVQKDLGNYLSNVKSLIEIDEFNLDEYLGMNGAGFKDKHRHDGGISYYASYAIVAVLFDKLGTDKMRQLLGMIREGSTYAEAVEALYPGGKKALDKDVRAMVEKRG